MARRQEEVRRGYGIDERNRVARIELLRAAVDPSLSRTEDSDLKPSIRAKPDAGHRMQGIRTKEIALAAPD